VKHWTLLPAVFYIQTTVTKLCSHPVLHFISDLLETDFGEHKLSVPLWATHNVMLVSENCEHVDQKMPNEERTKNRVHLEFSSPGMNF
jgi:hypothetical protein